MRPLLARLAVVLLLAAGLFAVAPSPARAELPSEDQWKADVKEAMQGGRTFLVNRAKKAKPQEKLAINVDVDNTTLATEYDEGAAVGPVLAFAAKAHDLGIKLFVNTARINTRRDETILQLEDAGYVVDRVCLRKDKESSLHSKQRCRKSFRDKGFTLIANIGNNKTDFQGGGYERAFKLPNYDGQLS